MTRSTGIRALELLLCGLLLLPSLFYPLARDQGLFAYTGQVILDGGFPYQDVFEQKGPATHYTFAGVIWLLGESALAIRFFFWTVALVGTQLAAAVGARLAGKAARLPCALCYAVTALHAGPSGPWMTGQVEDILLPLTLASILYISRPGALQRTLTFAVSGLLLGLTCVYKPTAIVVCLAVAAVTAYYSFRELPARAAIRNLLAAAASFCAPAGAVGLFMGANGIIDDFWTIVVEHNVAVYAKLQTGTVMQAFGFFKHYWSGLGLLALVGIASRPQGNGLLWRLLWAMIFGGLACLVWQWKFFILYHWTPLVGALSIVSGLGLTRMIQFIGEGNLSPSMSTTVKALVLIGGVALADGKPHLVHLQCDTAGVLMGGITLDEFQTHYQCGADTAGVQREVVAYLRKHTQPQDTVLVWGFDPAVNFLSGRRSPTRFASNRTLSRRRSPHLAAWRSEFMDRVHAAPPRYVLVADDQTRPWYVNHPRDDLRDFPELDGFLANNYQHEKTIGRFAFYRSRASFPRYISKSQRPGGDED